MCFCVSSRMMDRGITMPLCRLIFPTSGHIFYFNFYTFLYDETLKALGNGVGTCVVGSVFISCLKEDAMILLICGFLKPLLDASPNAFRETITLFFPNARNAVERMEPGFTILRLRYLL